ncbi:MAG: glutamyl-tRNA reductase [Anaerocolumna sp.]|jgi:glutamyl-tRNA reductase|nr:glutamyl-tRNA reductase [Anaerocolumna sp.]
MGIYNINISHRSAPVEIRALLAFTENEKRDFLKRALTVDSISECVLITTCNRTEIYVVGDVDAPIAGMKLLTSYKNVDYESMVRFLLRYDEDKAIKHLFRTACGLDSMLIGEDEILGQVKDDFSLAQEEGATGYHLNTIFRDAISCAKKIKTDTKLSKTPISIGTLTANEVFAFQSEKEIKNVLIIGLSGKMGTIVMKNLYHGKGIHITGTIRTHNLPNEVIMVYPKVKMIDYKERYDKIKEADIIISATSSPHYTLTYHELKKHLDTNKKRLFIDLSVPMDIDKEIQKLPNITIVDIDYFKKLSESNNRVKFKEAEAAELIIEEHQEELQKELAFRKFLPNIPILKEGLQDSSLENILYRLKNNTTGKDLEIVLKALQTLI